MQKANALAIDLDHIGCIVEDLIAARDLFTDLGFPPEETAILSMRADLMAQLRPS